MAPLSKAKVTVGIDASNIRGGGGLVHLRELLTRTQPDFCGIKVIVLWANQDVLDLIPNSSWLLKKSHPWISRNLIWRFLFQVFVLPASLKENNCDVLFVPGGSFLGNFKPLVAMSQNLLPFDSVEIRRFGISFFAIKLWLLRFIQSSTFKKADGVIFLTKHAREEVLRVTGSLTGKVVDIPHGVDQRFLNDKDALGMRLRSNFSKTTPFRCLYVSDIWPYKHHNTVIQAVTLLKNNGCNVRLDLIGGAGYLPSINSLVEEIASADPLHEFIYYHGKIAHGVMESYYHQADCFIFASSCETFGQIVTEAMAAGLPIVCSDKSSMYEILGSAGEYFNPEDANELSIVLSRVISSAERRYQMACDARKRIGDLTWEKCAESTLQFISFVSNKV